MGARKRRAADRAGRPAMRSPGRPPVGRREHRQRFWVAIARGLPSEDAGVAAGVSPAVGSRWFREGGGMPTLSRAPLSGRYLSFAEREELAILGAQAVGVRETARRLGRSPSPGGPPPGGGGPPGGPRAPPTPAARGLCPEGGGRGTEGNRGRGGGG